MQILSIFNSLKFCCMVIFPKQQILNSSKLRGFSDDNCKFEENGRKFFKNTVERGEIAQMSNFSFSHCVFITFVLHTRKNKGLFGKVVKK